MIHIVYADQAAEHRELLTSMFRHRALQFHERLKWDVNVDEFGFERDEYDGLNPLYVILDTDDGLHAGSLRLLPTIGNTMINDHFSDLTAGGVVQSPFIWECTRFCLAPNAKPSVSRTVVLAALELGLELGIQFFVGVFSRQMFRVYEKLGCTPIVIGEAEMKHQILFAGLWPVSQNAKRGVVGRHDLLAVSGKISSHSLKSDIV